MIRRTLLLAGSLTLGLAAAPPKISIVTDPAPGAAVRHGLGKLKEALRNARGEVEIVAGLAAGSGPAATLLREQGIRPPEGAEALVIRNLRLKGRKALVVSGADDRGLMYALLDVAGRIGWAKNPAEPLSEVKDASEKPAVAERALSIYTMQRVHFDSFFHDEKYWERYLDLLARNRFNSFVLVFGYECDGLFAPAYPYFFDVEGFPDVRVVGQTKDEQRRNYNSLKRLIAMAHGRGINFSAGLWDHIFRGGVQGRNDFVTNPPPGLVRGVTEKNLTAYISAALAKFLREFPEIDGIQFRMHGESGLKKEEMAGFWESLYQVMKRDGGKVRFTFRLKEFPDELINRAVDLNLNFRLATKYWMEQMGLPFHPTHIPRPNQMDRRHSYADVLRYPQRYKMHWRLWNGGTTRILLWGDPDYARRFAESTHLYDGEGFEVNAPLATKMLGQPHDAPAFSLLAPEYRYYDYEFERYWHFFQVFGRLGYNPETAPETWGKEFERRFGKDAGPLVERALHKASGILPRIVASVFPYGKFPTTRGWVEKQRWEDLPVYARAEGSDTQQFQSFAEAAAVELEKQEFAKIGPHENARWLAQVSSEVLSLAAEAEKAAGRAPNKELTSTLVDLRILAGLAEYHARRIPAGLNYALYQRSRDPSYFDAAIRHEREAIDAWRGVVRAAGDVYDANLRFGLERVGLSGHWRDELRLLETGLAELEKVRASLKEARPASAPRNLARESSGDHEPPVVEHTKLTSAPAGQSLVITARVQDASGVKWVRLRYRAVNQHQDFHTLPMTPTATPREYRAEVPAAQIDPKHDFMYLIEVMDNAGNGRIHPDLEKETPYVVVRLRR